MLKDRLKELMDRKGISILELERQTGIPANRMYKWYKQGTNPKTEDAATIEKWIEDNKADSYLEKRRNDKINTDPEKEGITFIPIYAQAGYQFIIK